LLVLIVSLNGILVSGQEDIFYEDDLALEFMGMMGAFMLIWFFLWIFFLIIGLISFIIWLLMLIDAIRRKKWENENEKVIWLLVIILGNVVGAIVYYFVIKRQRNKKTKKR